MLETSLVQNRGVNNLTPRTFGYDFTVSSFEHPIDIQTPNNAFGPRYLKQLLSRYLDV